MRDEGKMKMRARLHQNACLGERDEMKFGDVAAAADSASAAAVIFIFYFFVDVDVGAARRQWFLAQRQRQLSSTANVTRDSIRREFSVGFFASLFPLCS